MIYLIFNEGYSASGDTARVRAPLCEEAIRLARLLLRLFQSEPEIMGLTALLLLQHARAPRAFDADGAVVLLDDQDRSLWNRKMIAEGTGADRQGDAPSSRRPLSGAGGDRGAACAARQSRRIPTGPDRLLYATLEQLQPSPVVTLNRAWRSPRCEGPEAALAMIEPLEQRLAGYFHFFGVKGALLMQLGRDDEARVAFDRAIALANTTAEAAHIRMHLDRLMKDSAPRARAAT